MAKPRPDTLHGKTIKTPTGCGNLYITMNQDEEREICEIMLQMGKVGTCQNTLLRIIAVLFSILLQLDASPEIIKKTIKRHLLGVNCNNSEKLDDKRFSSCPDVIARTVLNEIEENKEKV